MNYNGKDESKQLIAAKKRALKARFCFWKVCLYPGLIAQQNGHMGQSGAVVFE